MLLHMVKPAFPIYNNLYTGAWLDWTGYRMHGLIGLQRDLMNLYTIDLQKARFKQITLRYLGSPSQMWYYISTVFHQLKQYNSVLGLCSMLTIQLRSN